MDSSLRCWFTGSSIWLRKCILKKFPKCFRCIFLLRMTTYLIMYTSFKLTLSMVSIWAFHSFAEIPSVAPRNISPSQIWAPDTSLHYVIYLLKCFSVLLKNPFPLSTDPNPMQIKCFLLHGYHWKSSNTNELPFRPILYNLLQHLLNSALFFNTDIHASLPWYTTTSLNIRDTLGQLNKSDYQQKHPPPLSALVV